MRIPSGTTDQGIFFVAVDETDLKTREPGFGAVGWTVYRCRDMGVSTAWTTPTIAELAGANMPGVYRLLLDEDTTLAAGNDSEAVVLHITHAGMAPVTLTYELYRPSVTLGQTLTVSAGVGQASVQSIAANAITAAATAADFGTEIAAAIWNALTSGLSTVSSIGKLLVDSIDATISSRASQTSVDDIPTNAELATALGPIALEATSINILGSMNDGFASVLVDTTAIAAGIADVPNNAEFAAAMAVLDADLDAILAGQTAANPSVIAAAVHNFTVEDSYTFKQITRLSAAALLGEVVNAQHANPITFKGLDGISTRITMTGDQYGNRSGPILNAEDA